MPRTPRASRPESPNYQIADADAGEGLLPWRWAEERLARCRNYFLSTVRDDGAPHVMPIWGLWLDGEFWFSTDEASRKARNLARNPRCVVTPEGGEEAVIVEGVAHEAPPGARHSRWAAAYKDKYNFDVGDNPSPVFRVTPHRVFGLIEKSFTKSATRWLFDESPAGG